MENPNDYIPPEDSEDGESKPKALMDDGTRTNDSAGGFFKIAIGGLSNVESMFSSMKKDLTEVATYVSEQSQNQVRHVSESMSRIRDQLKEDIKNAGSDESGNGHETSSGSANEKVDVLEEKLKSMLSNAENAAGSFFGSVLANVKSVAHANFGNLAHLAGDDQSPEAELLDVRLYTCSDAEFEEAFADSKSADNETSYSSFRATFSLDDFVDRINELLSTDSAVRSFYESLVPEKIEAKEFWQRFFWKKRELEHVKLLKQKARSAVETSHDLDLSWGEDDDESKAASEKEQSRKPSGTNTSDATEGHEIFEIVEKGEAIEEKAEAKSDTSEKSGVVDKPKNAEGDWVEWE